MESRDETFRLLLAFTSPAVDKSELLSLSATAAWPELLGQAAAHGVRPLVLRTLQRFDALACPDQIRVNLDQAVRKVALKNLHFTGEMLRVVAVFDRARIEVACFKGPALAQSVYGSVTLREFLDVDLIVRKQDFARASEILEGCGYRPRNTSVAYRAAFQTSGAQCEFRHVQTGALIDLHWQFSPLGAPFPIEADEIWPRLVPCMVGAHSVRTLAPDDLALFLASHGMKEGWRRLKWLADFAHFQAANQQLDWSHIAARARVRHCSRALLLGLRLTDRLYGVKPGGSFHTCTSVTSARALPKLADHAVHRLIHDPGKRVMESEFREFLHGLESCDRLFDRIRVVLNLLRTRTPADYSGMPLPRYLWPVYYITRLARLTKKGARAFLDLAGS